ncbi:hypothetical protein AVEN_146950-1 [Araneus ventricosus]|uniref:Uncharacterized protein n=1 Tax=Araneus ventricosus TaxID=182803 RepID=A0A4Y2QNF5_ARAVE|nr:hypothetical protein AVEN_146950-1 [Araneus ventricosus]
MQFFSSSHDMRHGPYGYEMAERMTCNPDQKGVKLKGRINAVSGSCKSTQLGLLSGDLIMGAGLPAAAGYRLRAVSCLCRKGLHSGQLSDDGVNSGGRYPLEFGFQ